MLIRNSTTTSRAIVVAVAGLSAVLLAYFSIRNARATSAIGLNTLAGYERAVRLEPGNPRNWYLLGRYWHYNMENPDAARAITYYRRSLSFDPNSADTWLDLATAYDGEGDVGESRRAFLAAKRMAPASADVAWRYGNFLVRQNELEAGFAEIRRAVLEDPKRGAEAFSRCRRVDPDTEAILQKVIPPSQETYVAILHDLADAREFEEGLIVWRHLVQLHPKVSPREAGPFANALWQAGRYKDLRSMWEQETSLMENPPPTPPDGSVLWDGGFETGLAGGDGLSWQIFKESGGVRSDFDRAQKHGGNQSLRLSFGGRTNVNYSQSCQNVVVEPGVGYRLSGWVQTKNLTTSEGIRFRISYLDSANLKSVESADVHGAEPWKNVTLDWTAPHETEALRLCIVRNPSDDVQGEIQGSAWIDDVTLTPIAAEPRKP